MSVASCGMLPWLVQLCKMTKLGWEWDVGRFCKNVGFNTYSQLSSNLEPFYAFKASGDA